MNSRLDFRLCFLMVCIWIIIPVHTHADSATSRTCEEDDPNCEEALTCEEGLVRDAVNEVVKNGGGTVYIPEGECIWENDVDVTGAVKIIGAGSDKTIIRSSYKQIFNHVKVGGDSDNYAEYAGISFYGRQSGGSSKAIVLYDATNFRIHHCRFEASQWHGVISGRRNYAGLIDNNTFIRNNLGSSTYGIAFSGSDTDKPDCGLSYTEACLEQWDEWYKKEGDYAGTGGSCSNAPYDTDWQPGSPEAIYIEDNTFDWYGSAIEMNWGSCTRTVWRYNTFNNSKPNSGGIKPGAVYFEIYGNTFNNISSGDSAAPNGGMMIRLRADGLFYNNVINGYGGPNDGSHIFTFVAYGCSFGYCYPDDVVPDEIFIWNNTYVDTGCIPSDSGCWAEYGEGEPNRIALNENYYFRAPGPGDRLHAFMQADETPDQHTYPHPLITSETQDTEPSPPEGQSNDGGGENSSDSSSCFINASGH